MDLRHPTHARYLLLDAVFLGEDAGKDVLLVQIRHRHKEVCGLDAGGFQGGYVGAVPDDCLHIEPFSNRPYDLLVLVYDDNIPTLAVEFLSNSGAYLPGPDYDGSHLTSL